VQGDQLQCLWIEHAARRQQRLLRAAQSQAFVADARSDRAEPALRAGAHLDHGRAALSWVPDQIRALRQQQLASVFSAQQDDPLTVVGGGAHDCHSGVRGHGDRLDARGFDSARR
jgi:hypothetical protein